LIRATLEPLYGDPAALTPALVDRYHDMLRAPGVRAAMVDRLAQYVLEDPRPSLAGITAPTLILWGERDIVIPVANAADFTAALPNDTLVTFPTLGHMPQEEAPEASLKAVRAFLD
jgi:pimeloyl-ACP methyl ester carboxylesterase